MRPSAVAKSGAAENNRGISGHVLTLHRRLYHALNLGCKNRESAKKWHCPDFEIQKLVIRSIDAFLECISSESLQHPLVKDSVDDMAEAIESILESKSQTLTRLAADVSVKMANVLPGSMLQSKVLDLIGPLVDLISAQELQVALSCATALNSILSKLSSRKDIKVLQILKETNAVSLLVCNITRFCVDDKPIEFFLEMASLLSKILWRWPPFRFCACNDSKFLNALDAAKLMSDNSAKVVVLQLYSTLALCRNAADKILESGEALMTMMVACMDCSNALSVRVEAFKLAQCLALSKRGCIQMMSICSEPLVKVVIMTIKTWNSQSEKLATSQMHVVKEACRLAFVTRWAGDHHQYFWKEGVDRVLLDLLLDNYDEIHQMLLEPSENDLAITVQQGIPHRTSQISPTYVVQGESAARAVVMMVYSRSKYIASMSRSILSKLLPSNSKDYLENLVKTLKLGGSKFAIPGNLQIVVSLLSLACHSSLPKYRKLVIKCEGAETLIAFIRWWLKNPVRVKRASLVPHLQDCVTEQICCFSGAEEWEGEDMLLLFSLWVLAELVHHSALKKTYQSEDQIVQELKELCSGSMFSPGSRWYAAYILCFFGVYGFPSKMGKRIGKTLGENENADLRLDLVNQEAVFVHEVILMVRCPSLLPPQKSILAEKSCRGADVQQDLHRKVINSVQISAHVDRQSLLKLLEFVYLGYLHGSDDLVKNLKILSKHCKLEGLLKMLQRRAPNWETPIPRFDLSPALEPANHHFSDILVEASTTELVHWKCNSCSASAPHLHVHKVVLESSSDYLQALFRSGMQESHSQTIKVPVSWDSLKKLVSWFYSDQLPAPNFGCVWDNLDPEEKLEEIQSYLELCWLAEFWLIRYLYEECYDIVFSCLNLSTNLPAKVIQVAADLSQWKLVRVAADRLAPSYHLLRNSGELDALDNNLVEMVRAASVRLSREGSSHQ
ncbi:BTB/POZ domain-containing protein At1g04390-like isoform X2 [Henckelia pumila]|uniref:BTB/POZ domain-containing protein At1g04390-like isoform X2 n=1 Tax=Henckelia pumila TaxID=405737 RepID=UPI003C6E96BF